MSELQFDPSLARGPAPSPSFADSGDLTVSQLTALVKQAVGLHLPSTVRVVGQISNFKRHGSGHLYWTLKDERCELSCVMWRSDAARMKFQPADGLEVVCSGSVDVFERAGRYQLYVRRMEPRGVGALELAFRQLCDRLRREGLFEAERKRAIPRFPRRIAVVTSPTGAAVRDVLDTLSRRYPCAVVYVCPVRVQGDGAAGEIAGAIRSVNRVAADLGGVDVLIVGRGGGSIEDLWAFNEEVVARAIHTSKIPVISAVGHEVDVTVADLVADVRAATPTAAAELAVPVLADVLGEIARHHDDLRRTLARRIDSARQRLAVFEQRTWLRDPAEALRQREQEVDRESDRVRTALTDRVHDRRRGISEAELLIQRLHPHAVVHRCRAGLAERSGRLGKAVWDRVLDQRRRLDRRGRQLAQRSPARMLERQRAIVESLPHRLARAAVHRAELSSRHVSAIAEKLEAMSHRATLARGFSITRLKKRGRIVRRAADVAPGDRLVTETAAGEIESAVVDTRQLELFD